jgi:hypothetical protein
VEIIGREHWGALPPRGPWTRRTRTDYIVLHHTAGPNRYLSPEEERAYQQQMQGFHMRGRGWTDIGQHYTVMRSGRIYEGRPRWTVGAHCAGLNDRSIGIETQGTFLGGAMPSPEQEAALAELIGMLCRTYDLDPRQAVTYHRRWNSTRCPGDLVARIPAIVERAVSGGTQKRRTRRSETMIVRQASGQVMFYVGPIKPKPDSPESVWQGGWVNFHSPAGATVAVEWYDADGNPTGARTTVVVPPGGKRGLDLYRLAGRPLDGFVVWRSTASDLVVEISKNLL